MKVKARRNIDIALLLSLVAGGCGSEEATPDTDPTLHPDGVPSCETLQSRIFQDPLTGRVNSMVSR